MTDQVATAEGKPNYVELTGEIVSAFVSHNSIQMADLPGLIANVHAALRNSSTPAPKQEEKPTPPIPIRRTITPDFLISLEDGKRYKSLKRHLSGRGLTPEQYREKWGLPRDYPMVAPNYSARRSELARSAGLGQKRAAEAAKKASTSERVAAPTARKRGRKKTA